MLFGPMRGGSTLSEAFRRRQWTVERHPSISRRLLIVSRTRCIVSVMWLRLEGYRGDGEDRELEVRLLKEETIWVGSRVEETMSQRRAREKGDTLQHGERGARGVERRCCEKRGVSVHTAGKGVESEMRYVFLPRNVFLSSQASSSSSGFGSVSRLGTPNQQRLPASHGSLIVCPQSRFPFPNFPPPAN